MSSVINKSGTRFIPKARQRRAPASTPILSKATPVIPKETPVENKLVQPETQKDDGLEGSTQVSFSQADAKDADDVDVEDNDDDDDGDDMDTNLNDDEEDLSQVSTQVEKSQPQISQKIGTSKSNRSASSNNQFTDKPNFKRNQLEKLPKLSASTHQQQQQQSVKMVPSRKRLSGITTKTTKVIESEKVTLNTLKRRKLSSRTPASKKSGSSHRISIVSKIPVPSSKSSTGTISLSKDEIERLKLKVGNDTLFEKTEDKYNQFLVKNLKQLPKVIPDNDSSKYLIDENNFTMAELCKRTLPIGEVSDNFERSKSAHLSKMAKRKEMRELRLKARTEFKSLQELSKEEDEKEKEKRKEAQEKLMNSEIPEERATQSMQLRMTADGNIAVDEQSTVVDRHKNASLENAQKKKVSENPFDNLYNNNTYGRNQYTDPWTPDELIKYYRALSMWGTDFNLIAQLFPYRTRRQVKAKFTNEEKKHPIMIELALRSKLPPNFEEYCHDIRKQLPTIDEFNEKLESLQKEHETHLKELEDAKNVAKLEDQTFERDNENKSSRRGVGNAFGRNGGHGGKKEVVLGTIDDIKRKREEEERKLPSSDEEESEEESEEEDEEEEGETDEVEKKD